MRKLSISILSMLAISGVFAQTKENLKKAETIAIHVGAFDFTTPQLIRSTSMGSVMSNDKWTKLKDQDLAIGISYMRGLSNYFDFSANYFLTSVDYPFNDGTPEYGTTYLLHEADASVHAKLLTDAAFFNPYLSVGIGASAYKGGRFDAFMPVGAGVQLKLNPATFVFGNFQYRVPVTERANYHFVASLGIGYAVGK